MSKIIGFIIIVFVLVGGYTIYNSLENDFEDTEGKKEFVIEGFKWLFQVGKSTKNTVGYVVKQDWLPKGNESNISVVVVD